MGNKKQDITKVVLAYSGGLDTSVIIRWMIETYGCEVIAFTADLGEGGDFKALRRKAIKTGATKCVVRDLRKEFVREYVLPAIKANALYEGKYPMATSLGRYIITKHLIECAREENADAIAHGSTGKGNDQVRFEVTAAALAPHIKVLAPVREWELKTREDEIEYARKWKIRVPVTKEKPYSIDSNLWGRSIECGALEDPWTEPPGNAYQATQSPFKAPEKGQELCIGFKKGEPVSLNGKRRAALSIIEEITRAGNRHGVGRIDMVENRVVGIKSREIYEAPAALILITAHKALEELCLERDTFHFKESIVPRYAELIYNGLWYSPLRSAFAAFVEDTQHYVSGEVRLTLYKGQCIVTGRRSPHSLYRKDLATYDIGDTFDRDSAKGFVTIYGLPLKVTGALHRNRKRS